MDIKARIKEQVSNINQQSAVSKHSFDWQKVTILDADYSRIISKMLYSKSSVTEINI